VATENPGNVVPKIRVLVFCRYIFKQSAYFQRKMSWRFNGDPELNINGNNPFLDMLAAIDEPAGAAGGQPEQPPAAVAESSSGRVKLPEFWPHVPRIWFARADLRFEVSKVTSEREGFAY
jgi:hypothetical protein